MLTVNSANSTHIVDSGKIFRVSSWWDREEIFIYWALSGHDWIGRPQILHSPQSLKKSWTEFYGQKLLDEEDMDLSFGVTFRLTSVILPLHFPSLTLSLSLPRFPCPHNWWLLFHC